MNFAPSQLLNEVSYNQECTAAGDGGASPTTKMYEFWFFYHQNVQILGFLPPKCTNFGFFKGNVQILGRHVTSLTSLAVHPWLYLTSDTATSKPLVGFLGYLVTFSGVSSHRKSRFQRDQTTPTCPANPRCTTRFWAIVQTFTDRTHSGSSSPYRGCLKLVVLVNSQ